MLLKDVIDVDFVNYKLPSMTLGFPKCSFKCQKECREAICQNGALANMPNIEISANDLVERYLNSSTSQAVVCMGLEPFDTWDDLLKFISIFREKSDDDIVIYTGYTKCEIPIYISKLKQFTNIIIKFGRYIPNQKPHYDSVLGVNLASDNQYSERIS